MLTWLQLPYSARTASTFWLVSTALRFLNRWSSAASFSPTMSYLFMQLRVLQILTLRPILTYSRCTCFYHSWEFRWPFGGTTGIQQKCLWVTHTAILRVWSSPSWASSDTSARRFSFYSYRKFSTSSTLHHSCSGSYPVQDIVCLNSTREVASWNHQ